MDWVQRMNSAIGYMEEHLTDDDIDFNEAARRACCSVWHFQRMFAFLADQPLSEYVRRRRLTLAALDLQTSGLALADIAVKYGYDCRESFTRAFKALHGISPSAARSRGAVLKACPPIRFHISIKGEHEMQYRMEELGPFTVIGYPHTVNTHTAYPEILRIWGDAKERDLFETLWQMRRPGAPEGVLGVCAGGGWGKNETFTYALGVASDQPLLEGMTRYEYPRSTWVVFTAEGAPDELPECWRQFYTAWVPASSAVYDLADLPALECYLPIEAGKNELWIAVTPV